MEINDASRIENNWMTVGVVMSADKVLVRYPNHSVCARYKVSIKILNGDIIDYLFYPDDKIHDFLGQKITYLYKKYNDNSIGDLLHIYS